MNGNTFAGTHEVQKQKPKRVNASWDTPFLKKIYAKHGQFCRNKISFHLTTIFDLHTILVNLTRFAKKKNRCKSLRGAYVLSGPPDGRGAELYEPCPTTAYTGGPHRRAQIGRERRRRAKGNN